MMLIGAMNKALTYLCVFGTIIVATALSLDHSTSDSRKCNGIVYLICFQNFMIGVGAHLVGNQDTSLKILTQIPFVCIFVRWFIECVLPSIKYMHKYQLPFMLLLLSIVVAFLNGHGNIQAILITVRNLTVFYMAFEIGKKCLLNYKDYQVLGKLIVEMSVFLTIVGIIILFYGYPLYRAIGIHEVYIAKAAPFAEGALDGRFYTSFFSGRSFVRMGSLFYEPVNIAYFLSLAFILSVYNNFWNSKKIKMMMVLLTGIGLLLSGGKGGWIIGAVTIICVSGKSFFLKFKGRIKSISSWIIVVLAILVAYIFVQQYTSKIGMAVMNHIWGITNTWKVIIQHPFGYGIGTGGNAAQVFSGNTDNNTWLSSGGETALLSFAYQIGIPGIIVFIINFLNTRTKELKDKRFIVTICFFLPFILLGVSIMQDNTFTVQCIVPFMLIQGAVKNIENSEINNDKNYCNVSASVS
jgi:hypothetical protein